MSTSDAMRPIIAPSHNPCHGMWLAPADTGHHLFQHITTSKGMIVLTFLAIYLTMCLVLTPITITLFAKGSGPRNSWVNHLYGNCSCEQRNAIHASAYAV